MQRHYILLRNLNMHSTVTFFFFLISTKKKIKIFYIVMLKVTSVVT